MAKWTDDEIVEAATEAARLVGEPRCLFINGALALRNLAYADPQTRDQYVEDLYFWGVDGVDPGEHSGYTPTQQQRAGAYAMGAVQSSCGITTRRIWRYAGVDAPQIYDYYGNGNRIGTAVSYEMKFGQGVGAWRSGIPWVEGTPLPAEGDAPIVGCHGCGPDWSRNSTNTEHEFTIVATDPTAGLWYSLDGGQPGIALRTRGIVEVWTGTDSEGRRTGELWAGVVGQDGTCAIASDGRPQSGRRFVGFNDAAALPLRPTPPDRACGGGLEQTLAVLEGLPGPVKAAGAAAGLLAFGLGLQKLGKLWLQKGAPFALRR